MILAKILDNKGQVDTFILDFEIPFDNPLINPLKVNYSAIASCWKRSEVRLGYSLVGCPTGHHSWSFAILVEYLRILTCVRGRNSVKIIYLTIYYNLP